jgi:glycosyltransferase involved in cell wall biosynthesis
MPTYMRAHLLAGSIRTILNQSFEDFELLVQDDCSHDATEKVVHQFKDPRIRYHRNEINLGMPENLNQGIRAARGEYVVVCHDHDLYNWRLLKKMVSLLDEHPSVGMVHTGIALIDQEGCGTGVKYVRGWPTVSAGKQWLRFMLSSFHCPVCANAMVRRSVHEELGLYDPDFGFVADVEMWMRISLAYDIGYIREPLIQVRERDGKAATGQVLHWPILDAIIRMHQRYCQKFYNPPQVWPEERPYQRAAGRKEIPCPSRVAGLLAGSRAFVNKYRWEVAKLTLCLKPHKKLPENIMRLPRPGAISESVLTTKPPPVH